MTVSLKSIGGDGVEQRQAKRLRRSRALATGLLILAGALFAATLMVRHPGPVVLLRAVAEAALVGGGSRCFARQSASYCSPVTAAIDQKIVKEVKRHLSFKSRGNSRSSGEYPLRLS